MKSILSVLRRRRHQQIDMRSLLIGEVQLANRSEKLLKIASDLQACLQEADRLNASLAAIKILEAHDAVLNLADEDMESRPVVVRIDIPRSSVVDSKV